MTSDSDLKEIENKGEVKTIPLISDYFRVEEHESEWRYFCKRCRRGWRLSKENANTGNLLYLLNHARGHLPKPKKILPVPKVQ
jgi:hypothetical protein